MLEQIFYETVKADIEEFNKTRKRRKELNPHFVNWKNLGRFRKFGRFIEYEEKDEDAFGTVRRLGHATFRTMLQRKPRPAQCYIDIAEYDRMGGTPKLMARLFVPKRIKLINN